MKYKESRRLEPDEHRRLGALRVELANRAKAGKWQMPLMVLFVIVLVVALRIIGAVIAALVLNVWLPKYRTAKEFTKSLGSEGVEPVVDRFVEVEGESIDGLFVNEKPRPVKPNQYVMSEMEVLARRFTWSVNGNPVPMSLAVVREVAMPPPEVEMNIDRLRGADAPDSIKRSLTAFESEELFMHHRSIKRQSVFLRWLKIGGIFFVGLFAIGVASSINDGVMDGILVFGIIAAVVFVIFAFAGWSMDRGILRDYLRLRKDISERNVVLTAHPRPEYRGRLVEVLERSGALWTVDGQPARWRTQV